MNHKKAIHITTHCIDLTIKYNKLVVSSLFTTYLGLFLIACFSRTPSVTNTAAISLLIVTVVSICALLYGFHSEKVDVTDGAKNDAAEKPEKPVSTEAPAEVGEVKRSQKKDDTSKSTQEIKNRVPIPNPTSGNEESKVPPSSADENSSAIDNPDTRSIPLTEMSEEDWNQMFQFEEDL